MVYIYLIVNIYFTLPIYVINISASILLKKTCRYSVYIKRYLYESGLVHMCNYVCDNNYVCAVTIS